jgi:hypothetical protein
VESSPPQSPTIFLFGIGAQKSGTTWLYAQLDKHPEIGFGWKKEISMWGLLWDKKLTDRQPKRLRHRIQNKLYHFPNGRRIPHYPMFTPWLAREYFDEFKSLAATGRKVVADVTPHYSAMSEKGFRTVKRLAEKSGFNPRVLFIMRDPVERVISGIIHSNRRLKNPTNEELVRLVQENYRTYPVFARTRYDITIGRVEKVFSPEEICYLFFEDLFSKDSIDTLSRWLDISDIPANFAERVGPRTHTVTIPGDLRHEIREFYQPVYSFCRDKFGHDTISAKWQNT